MNDRLLVSSVRQHELTERAEQAATALRQSERELVSDLARMTRLQALSIRIAQNSDMQALLQDILAASAEFSGTDKGNIQFLIRETGKLRIVVHQGLGERLVSHFAEHGWVATCDAALQQVQRVIVEDVTKAPGVAGTVDLDIVLEDGIRAIQSTPLLSRNGRLLGLLNSHFRRVHRPTESDLRYLDLLARMAADLIDRTQAEEELRKSELGARQLLELYRATTLSMGEGLFTVDARGRITSINPEAERLLGRPASELLGLSMDEATHRKHQDDSSVPAEVCAALQVLENGEALKDFEDTFITKDGSRLPVSYSSSPLRDQQGAIVGLVVVFQDITERIRSREAMAAAAREMAQMNRRKDEFLAMLSHELRNPLAPIRTAVHLLRLQERGSENLVQQQAGQIIERQVGNLTKIVSDLLDVSRVISGRINLSMQVLDVNEVVQHAIETAQPLLDYHRHVVSYCPCDDNAWVNADATRLEEVIVNLLNNAAKYTPDGGAIEVDCEQRSQPRSVEVRVRDNGVGIPEDLLRGGRLFDLFTQADRTLARSSGGLGIGLSLAHRLIELQGGSIEVHSPPTGADKGSEFIVSLPLAPPECRPPKRVAAPPIVRSQQLRILVVDDNVDLVMVITSALRHHGYGVQAAYTGPDGLKIAQEWRPDVVLLDIGLPGLDGYEVARRLRGDPSLRADHIEMKLIAMTGYGRETDQAMAREAGFDAHLLKPVEFNELEKLIVMPRGSHASGRGRAQPGTGSQESQQSA
jgi:PAS domain S-box-containing protein